MRDQLHWLPISERINFKVAILTYKALHEQAPDYLTAMCHRAADCEGLSRNRSAANGQLIPSAWNTVFYGKRSFHYSAPEVWNSLPVDTRQQSSVAMFAKELKTLLFCRAYNV